MQIGPTGDDEGRRQKSGRSIGPPDDEDQPGKGPLTDRAKRTILMNKLIVSAGALALLLFSHGAMAGPAGAAAETALDAGRDRDADGRH